MDPWRAVSKPNLARRGFCADFGTPLTYEYDGGIEACHRPSTIRARRPRLSVQGEPGADCVTFRRRPANLTMRPDGAEPRAKRHRVIDYQHHYHDTEAWPVREES
jgi:hypothetical protein